MAGTDNMGNQAVTIRAKPHPIKLDLARTAVLVVDMQNDFGAAGGIFERAGVDIRGIQGTVAPTKRVLDSARASGMKVVYLKMGFQPDLSDLGSVDAPNRVRHLFFGVGKSVLAPNGAPSRLLVRGTWNTEILPELVPGPSDDVVWKHRFSGFYETELHSLLQRKGIRYLVVTGCTTSICVESTVRDAMFRDYACLLLEDCMAEPIGQDLPTSCHQASLVAMQTLFAWVSDSGEFVRALAVPVAVAQTGA